MDRDNLDLTELVDAIHIVRRGRETAVCCRMVLGEKGLAVSLNMKMLLMNGKASCNRQGKIHEPNIYQTLMIHWNETLYTDQNMSMIRTGTIPLSKKNFNKPLSQGGYQSRTKLDRLVEVRYLMPWGCERMCAGQATLGECQTEQKCQKR